MTRVYATNRFPSTADRLWMFSMIVRTDAFVFSVYMYACVF